MKTILKSSVTAFAVFSIFSCSTYKPDTSLTEKIHPWEKNKDDSPARIALRKATHDASLNPKSALKHELDLLYALETTSSPEVKVTLIHELKLIGSVNSIKPLSKYLTDPTLSSHAAQALVNINLSVKGHGDGFITTFTVFDALKNALPMASGEPLVHIVKALGSVKQTDSKTTLILHAILEENPTYNLKIAILNTLAELGADESQPVLQNALQDQTQYNRSKIISINLLYARNLAKNKGVNHTLKIMSKLDKNKESHSYIQCLVTLSDLKGNDFTDDLLSYLGDENLRIVNAVCQLLSTSTDSSLNEKLFDLYNKNLTQPLIQQHVLKIVTARKADKFELLINKSLSSENQELKTTATSLAHLAKAENVVDSLIRLLLSENEADKNNSAVALSRFPAKEIAGALITSYEKSDINTKIILLSIMETKKNSSLADKALEETTNENTGIKKAAFKAIKNIVEISHTAKILELMRKTEKSSDISGYQAALVSASLENQNLVAAQIAEKISKGSSTPSNLALLQTLPRIGGKTAFNTLINFTKNNSAEAVEKEAYRALAKWDSIEQFPELLTITQNSSGTEKILLIRGLSTLIVNSSKTIEEKKNLLQSLSSIAPNDEEKNKILDQSKSLK